MGIGLASAVGFRIFLPLFALSLAAYFGVWELNEQWAWLGGITAVITLGVATTVETVAYFIPWLDNVLDSFAVPLAALAGTAVMVATVTDVDPVALWALAIIAGGGTATAIKGAGATGRVASSLTTGGLGNPVVTVLETITSFIVSLAAVFVPVLAAVLAALILFLIYRIYRRTRPKKRQV